MSFQKVVATLIRRWAAALGVVAACFALIGCEPAPEIMAVGSVNPRLVSQDDVKEFDWPVAGGQWQVARPTSIASIRRLQRGSMGDRFAEIQREREARIEAAAKSVKPAPWSVDAYEFEPEHVIWLKELLGEVDNELQHQLVVDIPSEIKNAKVQLDFSGRRLLLLNNSLTLCRLPWRDWYATPTTPPQETDEPGSPDTFDRIELPGADLQSDVMAEFFGDAGMIIAAQGKNLFTIDCDKKEIVASTDVGNRIVYIDVAVETGDAIGVDEFGKLFLFNHQLNQMVGLGEVDLELPMPVISPEAARVSMYKTKTSGHVVKIQELVVLDRYDVPLQDAGEPLAMRSGRVYDLWIEKNAVHKRPNYPNTQGDDRKTFRATIYWDIVDVVDRHTLPRTYSQFCIARRPLPDGGTQLVGFDASLGNRNFFAPLPLPDLDDGQLAACGSGMRVCIAKGQKVHCYYRILDYTSGLTGLYDAAREFTWNAKTETMEKLSSIILALPEDRHDRRPQQLYSELVRGISDMWWTVDVRKDNKELSDDERKESQEAFDKIEAWAAKKSTLALSSKMAFHSTKAWSARGGGYSSTVSQDGWSVFERENRLGIKVWEELQTQDAIPASAYGQFIQLARDTGLEYADVSDVLKECMHRYPIDDTFHHEMMNWLLEKWGGSRGSSTAYAAAVADAIGPPRGDFVYSRLVQRIAPNYPNGFYRYAQVDSGRVLRGLREGMRMEYWQKASTIESMLLLGKAHTGPGATRPSKAYTRQAVELSQELGEYYQSRYPMLLSEGTKSHNLPLLRPFLPK
ncbi:MAG: hypothetical protein HKN47_25500 [Pirellulaceae bacterium]|nr:hypothetical protein [Pirellulaceae bacterium]